MSAKVNGRAIIAAALLVCGIIASYFAYSSPAMSRIGLLSNSWIRSETGSGKSTARAAHNVELGGPPSGSVATLAEQKPSFPEVDKAISELRLELERIEGRNCKVLEEGETATEEYTILEFPELRGDQFSAASDAMTRALRPFKEGSPQEAAARTKVENEQREFLTYRKPLKILMIFAGKQSTKRRLFEFYVDSEEEAHVNPEGGISITDKYITRVEMSSDLNAPMSWARDRYGYLLQVDSTPVDSGIEK